MKTHAYACAQLILVKASYLGHRGGLWIYWQVRCGLIILLRITKLIWIVWSGGEATEIGADWASSRLQYGRILQHRTLRIGFVCIGSKAMIGLDIALNFTQRFSEVGIMLSKCCSPLNRPSSWILHLCDVLRVHRVYRSPSVCLSHCCRSMSILYQFCAHFGLKHAGLLSGCVTYDRRLCRLSGRCLYCFNIRFPTRACLFLQTGQMELCTLSPLMQLQCPHSRMRWPI